MSRNIINDKKHHSRMTSATGSSLPMITNQLGHKDNSKHGRNKTMMSESVPSILSHMMPQSPWGRLNLANHDSTPAIQKQMPPKIIVDNTAY